MAAVRTDHFSVPSGTHDERVLAWSSVLGDVVEADRDDRVGGALHVRPAVAPR